MSSCENNDVQADLINSLKFDNEDVQEIDKDDFREKKRDLEPDVSESGLTDRKKKSPYWQHFDKTDKPDYFICKYCDKVVRYVAKNGTSVLKNHCERCKQFPSPLNKKQKLFIFYSKMVLNEDGSIEEKTIPRLWVFDQDLCRESVVKMIVMDELPFLFVEREGFRQLCKVLCPQFKVPSRSTITRDCYDQFIDERKILKTFFENLSSRVNLTTDTWTSGQNLSYMCLMTHFIDDNWKLHKKIINFCPITGHSGELIGKAVEKCLIEWDLKRIMTMTVDNASSKDLAVQYLKRRIKHWGGGVLESEYLHMRCASQILNLVVKDGLSDIGTSIKKVRAAVRYVRSSPARLSKFKACVAEEMIESKKLVCLDVETRWNSTFLMLESALKFRLAFDNMKSKGGPYVKELVKHGGAPNDYDWNVVNSFLPFLRIFYNATVKLSGCRYVTGNRYMPEIYGVGYLVNAYCDNEDNIKKMAITMKVKYDKY